ncbi:MAG: bifunctional methylenetetrahydrofolate dehydrogenase/methenyltetrahydrofolate cyclohydrolase FolD [Kiritimatiellae bacterium]|nr:bifunctional methylenetetrahydrofolate dehydrogenase/methenyltetrahydrofolate cyclohydrolase FolD [Kiritimatiellia bacterium]
MTARLLDGRAVAAQIRDELRPRIAALAAAAGRPPGLAVVRVGDDPASQSYVAAKRRACSELGLVSIECHLPATASRADILAAVERFNEDPTVDGILVQLPLPDPSIEADVIEAIRPDKDVDGFHPLNVGRMLLGLRAFLPCTPHGIVQLLRRSGIATPGAHVVVIGRSHIVGRPLAHLLSRKGPDADATVTLCHTRTRDLAAHTRQADIVVAAAGRPGTVRGDMIREGAVVVDVGVNRLPDPTRASGYRLVGDVDFESVAPRAAAITPVPGGVGPMTIAMLLANTVAAAEWRGAAR